MCRLCNFLSLLMRRNKARFVLKRILKYIHLYYIYKYIIVDVKSIKNIENGFTPFDYSECQVY